MLQVMKIESERDAKYITAFDEKGAVLIRCNFEFTDCGEDEPLPKFVERHGGVRAAAIYLHDAYQEATSRKSSASKYSTLVGPR